ncbi:hypothetical protein GUITHDRAFT_139983 [Guillardia theta CCMP2712]|uniref:Uncharacterized protein n=1 Tax=Guillardia theta (strain CCMP2712) TaxID=905079 RepID=L1J6H0_GUITC|nr:hypothetical protein GUITHDRAFT_139983 [Guillardia theta CCMP2712]EKX44138.1 hypothetical protein GUITHDRAFT_139983 [Guillardia theta CCMP2712]|eukprot:XP_005831118.1 hypothetical protein GUITHDRAFT_139983 [Guillardia theta CCMP2712]
MSTVLALPRIPILLLLVLLLLSTCNAASKCYLATQDITPASCAKMTVTFGSCESQATADTTVKALSSATIAANTTACLAMIDSSCGFLTRKATTCDPYCTLSIANNIAVGCRTDAQCTSTTSTFKAPLCCSYRKKLYGEMCVDANGMLDTMIANSKTSGECSDAAGCIDSLSVASTTSTTSPTKSASPSAYSFASLPLVLLVAAVGVVKSSTGM